MSGRTYRFTVGRLPTAAIAYGASACLVPLVFAAGLVLGVHDASAGLFGIFAFSVTMLAVGIGFGWVPLIAVSATLYGIVALDATSSLGSIARAVAMVGAGSVVFVSLGLADESFSRRRSPLVEPGVSAQSARGLAVVTALAAGMSLAAVAIAQASRWPALVLPLALLALGVVIQLVVVRVGSVVSAGRHN